MVEIISVIKLLIILFSVCLSSKQLLAIGRNNTDYKSLIAFKKQFLKQSDVNSSTIFSSSWNATNHFCSWEGVTCGYKHRDRVTALDLRSVGLAGPLPPSILNLTFLRRLDLSFNRLYGEIPPILACLPRLQHLNLSFNSFDGDIDAILTMNHSSVLQVLDLDSNHMITGKIPLVINSFSPLKYLSLSNNDIVGTIPPSLTNLSVLESFYAFSNHLEGGIPPEIGVLHNLKDFNVADNKLTEALEYLHHSCQPPIIHGDIKPSNILLDNSIIAHVGDFGLSRMLFENLNICFQDSFNQSGIKGTIGYIAPEYGELAPLSPSADVYSFGIVLLEMLIGRRPTDDVFSDNLTLHNHIKMILPHGIKYIVDLKMFRKEQREASEGGGENPRWFSCQSTNKCLLSLAELGLSCSVPSPKERPSMEEVTAKLNAIRASYVPSI
ncbi:receptor kinase-like protein Xa21 [Phalaenopsis equestris]|uniref:receptor kinase-like protein Xa21 n=1 Tax=Phalaenopsis equestris TaxID=78828 RepID=UPI0009E2DB53|nr:receptor kinase-like protein Xa21 [Phalaenopsis equestris]